MEIKDKLREMLVHLRLQKDLTQKDLAEAIGVNTTRYSNWEQGLRTPGFEQVQGLCVFHCVDPNYILGFSPMKGTALKVNSYVGACKPKIPKANGKGLYTVNGGSDGHSFSEQWLTDNNLEHDQVALFRITENASVPEELLNVGDEILVDFTTRRPPKAKLFAIAVNDEIFVRYITKKSDGSFNLSIGKGKNIEPDEHLTAKQFEALKMLGCVAWVGRNI